MDYGIVLQFPTSCSLRMDTPDKSKSEMKCLDFFFLSVKLCLTQVSGIDAASYFYAYDCQQ